MLRRTLALIVLTFFAAAIDAQVVGGTISGTVTDSTGAVIPNAVVVVHNQDTGTQRTLTTNSAGAYSAPSIPVGTYLVTTTVTGFAPFSRDHISLAIGQSLVVPIALTGLGTSGTVDVFDAPQSSVNISRPKRRRPGTGRRARGERSAAGMGDRIRSASHAEPGDGELYGAAQRWCRDVELLGRQHVCGVGAAAAGQSLSAEWRGVYGGFADQRDAGRDQWTAAGSRCAVREFNVVSDSYSAAYGKRDGAQISIVTASGTNTVSMGVGL